MKTNDYLKAKGLGLYHDMVLISEKGEKYPLNSLLTGYRNICVPKVRLTIENVLEQSCNFFNMSRIAMTGTKRCWEIVKPRMMTMVCMVNRGFKSNEIANAFNKERTTINNAQKTVYAHIKKDEIDNKLFLALNKYLDHHLD